MSKIRRRHFLQAGGSTLAAALLSNYRIQRQGLRMAKGLAQDTPRKLALLVGINQYKFDPKLNGCVHDVESQRELLIHRFGFQPQDILMVSDDSKTKPTRKNILATFEDHLIKQAKPGDVAVFHFSGHGSLLFDPDSIASNSLSSTLIPNDGERKKLEDNFDDIFANDITGRTLFLLMAAVQTDNLTAVLDSCHSGGGTRGTYRVRSIDRASNDELYKKYKPAELELDYRRDLQARMKIPAADLYQDIPKGVILSAAQYQQKAAEIPFDGFYAGAFSYVLTRYLWQMSEPTSIVTTFDKVASKTTPISERNQIPKLYIAEGQAEKPTFFVEPTSFSGDGVVRNRTGLNVEMWLGGLFESSLAAFNPGSQLIAVDKNGQNVGEIQLTERNGLEAKGKICQEAKAGAIASGTMLQERLRMIPEDFRLKVGLDDSLGTTSIGSVEGLEKIEFQTIDDDAVDYILAKVTKKTQKEFAEVEGFETTPPIDSIGLFSAAMSPLPGSFGEVGESVNAAVSRLTAKINGLLAVRWLKLALNADSSRLNVKTAMVANGDRTIVQKVSTRGSSNSSATEQEIIAEDFQNQQTRALEIPLGTRIRLDVRNFEQRDLYLTVLVVDATGDIGVVFPNDWSGDNENVNRLPAGQILSVPSLGDDFELVVRKPLGTTEVLIVTSSSPMASSLKALTRFAKRRGQTRGPQVVDSGETVSLVRGVHQDNSSKTIASSSCPIPEASGFQISTSEMVAFSLSFVATAGKS